MLFTMKYTSTILLFFLSLHIFGQDAEITTTNKFRVNFLNPAIELDRVTGKKSILTTGIGVGYGGGYPDLTFGGSGFIYIISPFLDVQQKWFTNLEKRNQKGKNTANNSGNFISLRLLVRGESLAENVIRTSNTDFAIGPTWGIQRSFGENFHFLFDIGSVYYFDTEGNGNIFPINLQFNIGYNIK